MTSVDLLYGDGSLRIDLPSDNVTLITPSAQHPLANEAAACREAFDRPIGAPPIKEVLRGAKTVALVIPDGTRPLPFERLLNWALAETDTADCEVVIVVGTGSHRANTDEELRRMLGDKIFHERRVVNHSAFDDETLALAGEGFDGQPVRFNRETLEADRRIVFGFIEPHFVAGFSGGYKGVMPGVVDIDTILHYHRAQVIGDPRSTWGVLEGNPTQAIVRGYGQLCPIDFLVNITMTPRKEITGFFCGHPIEAHGAGCQHIKAEAMAPVDREFPIVLTCNNGYPLDQNLYQAVKGMSAAAMITQEGGLILQASECRDGFPDHGNFKKLLFDHDSAEALLKTVNAPGFRLYDQWEAQLLAMIRVRARMGLHSLLPDDELRRAYVDPAPDLAAAVQAELDRIGADAPIAVLPTGFATVPYVA